MTQHFWTVLTKKSYIDQDSNVLVVGEILENIRLDLPEQMREKFDEELNANKKLILPFDFELVSYLGSDKPNSKVKLLVEVQPPTGKAEKIGEMEISTGDTGKVRHRFRANGLVAAESGFYAFKLFDVSDKKKKLAEVPLKVDINFV